MEPYEEDAKPRVTISCYFQLDDFNDGKWFHMSTYAATVAWIGRATSASQ